MKAFGAALGREAAGWALIGAAILTMAGGVGRLPGAADASAELKAPFARLGGLLAGAAASLSRPTQDSGPVRFTDLPKGDVRAALTGAAEITGVSRPYLVSTARKESSFDPDARAATSSATGLFQFVDATWLEMIDRYGAKYGLAREAALVKIDRRGRPRIADPVERRRVLNLRTDPRVSALLAGELTRQNAETLSARLKRAPTDGELYVAHFLGAQDAVRLIVAAERQPRRQAAELFPAAARRNQAIFYRAGRPRTVAEVMRRLT